MAEPRPREQVERDLRATWERNMAYYRERCAQGRRDYCEAAACQVLVYEDTDANLVGCVKVRGWRMGNGWYTPGGWEQTPQVPTSDWWFKIECIRKVGGLRPHGTLWRKNGVPESSVDVEAEAAKICAGGPRR